MADEQTPQTPPAEPPAAPALPPELEERLKKVDALERQNKDFLAEIKKLKSNGKNADEAVKTAEQWQGEAKKARAAVGVWRSLNAEGIKVESDEEADLITNAILSHHGVEIGDDGSVKGVGDALKTLRKVFGPAAPEQTKPEAQPAMAKPKANAAPADPKFASVNRMKDLVAMGASAFNEFQTKYPDRFSSLR